MRTVVVILSSVAVLSVGCGGSQDADSGGHGGRDIATSQPNGGGDAPSRVYAFEDMTLQLQVGGMSDAPMVLAAIPTADDPPNREQIRTVVRNHRAELLACYYSALGDGADESGRVVMEFMIGAGGTVTRATVTESQLESQAVITCMTAEAGTWEFPAPNDGGTVQVDYSFFFEEP